MCSGDAAPLDSLARAVAALAGEDPLLLPCDTLTALTEELVQLRRLTDALEAAFTRRVGALDRTQAYAPSSALSAASWLRSACRLSGSAAADRVRLARHLPHLPGTAAAFASGDIGCSHASVIARSAAEVGTEAAREAEPILLQAARDLDPGRLRLVTRHLRHALDPDGALGDGRSAAQRRADALVDLARRQLDIGELPEVAGERPHLTLTAEVATLAGWAGAPAGEMEWGHPVPAETVRRLACDAVVTPVLLGEGGEPLSVGRARRTVPAAVRRALAVRDGGCAWPGCDRPRAWTDVHHVVHWADGGPSSLGNVAQLCRPHHRLAHEGRWRLELGAGGALTAIPP